MKHILVPVDFSEPSTQAAQYAIALATHLNAEKVVLYNAYQQPIPTDPMLTEPTMNAMNVYDVNELSDISRDHLHKFKDDISNGKPDSLQIEVIGEFNDIIEGIQEVCAAKEIDLVITGITVGDKLTETLAGSHSLDIAREISTPVLIVPHEATFQPIRNILLVDDYKQVAGTTPVPALQSIVRETGAQLHVLHISESGKEADLSKEEITLKGLLQDLLPQYHTVHNADFAAAVNTFITQNNIDLIAAIPKKHGFLESLFHKSHVKTLAFDAHVPILMIHKDGKYGETLPVMSCG